MTTKPITIIWHIKILGLKSVWSSFPSFLQTKIYFFFCLMNPFLQTLVLFRYLLAQAIHDYSLTDALGEYLEGKICVGIMGGHKLLRASDEYREVVMLALNLARNGFLICTGM